MRCGRLHDFHVEFLPVARPVSGSRGRGRESSGFMIPRRLNRKASGAFETLGVDRPGHSCFNAQFLGADIASLFPPELTYG